MIDQTTCWNTLNFTITFSLSSKFICWHFVLSAERADFNFLNAINLRHFIVKYVLQKKVFVTSFDKKILCITLNSSFFQFVYVFFQIILNFNNKLIYCESLGLDSKKFVIWEQRYHSLTELFEILTFRLFLKNFWHNWKK